MEIAIPTEGRKSDAVLGDRPGLAPLCWSQIAEQDTGRQLLHPDQMRNGLGLTKVGLILALMVAIKRGLVT